MLAKIQKWGNSQGVRFPKQLLETDHFAENDAVLVEAREGVIIITKAKPPLTLDLLFQGYKGTYRPTEEIWGEPQGKEVW